MQSKAKSSPHETNPPTFSEERGLLEQIVEKSGLVVRDEDPDNARKLLAAYLDAVLKDKTVPEGHYSHITTQIGQVDALLAVQLDEILHHPEFQALESRWRGIDHFVRNTVSSPMIQIKILNVGQKELYMDLKPGAFKSQLYKKIYQEEYGVLGGHPYGALIADFEFSHSSSDVELLRNLASVASVSHAPLIAGTSPEMFGRKDFSELEDIQRLGRVFEDDLYKEWNAFRKSEDSRYVALVLPRVLVRPPYNPANNPVDGLDYTENIIDGEPESSGNSAPDPRHVKRGSRGEKPGSKRKLLWGTAALLMAERLTDAFSKYEWCMRIRGVEGGGIVEDAPVCVFPTGDGGSVTLGPGEIIIPDDHEKQLSDLGFLPLCQNKSAAEAVFISGQTTQLPTKSDDEEETQSAELSAKLPYMLAVSRFAHFVKVMMRDKIGSFASTQTCQKFLTKWIAQYIEPDENASEEAKAKRPLHEATIIVRRRGRAGVYEAEMFLKPHFQLEEFKVAIRLVAELPKPMGK